VNNNLCHCRLLDTWLSCRVLIWIHLLVVQDSLFRNAFQLILGKYPLLPGLFLLSVSCRLATRFSVWVSCSNDSDWIANRFRPGDRFIRLSKKRPKRVAIIKNGFNVKNGILHFLIRQTRVFASVNDLFRHRLLLSNFSRLKRQGKHKSRPT